MTALTQAIETIQQALSESLQDNLKIEITHKHAYMHYGNLKFLMDEDEPHKVLEACVYLSGQQLDSD